MVISEKIQLYAQQLPPTFQAEVLDFIEYLLTKSDRQEDQAWGALSLAVALQDLEDEAEPVYTMADLAVPFA